MSEGGGPDSGVRVTIFGEDYLIRSEMGAEYTRKCARYVDESIQSAHVKSHVSEPKAAILAAMEITDQLFRVQSRAEDLERNTSERIRSLVERIESSLEE